MSERWLEIGHPSRQHRNCSIQVGWRPFFSAEAWLDTGYEASRFEFTFGVAVGPWRYSFDWRPSA